MRKSRNIYVICRVFSNWALFGLLFIFPFFFKKKTILYKYVYFTFMLISTLNIQNKFTYSFYVFTQIYYFFNTLLLNKNFVTQDHLFINVKNMGCYNSPLLKRIWSSKFPKSYNSNK